MHVYFFAFLLTSGFFPKAVRASGSECMDAFSAEEAYRRDQDLKNIQKPRTVAEWVRAPGVPELFGRIGGLKAIRIPVGMIRGLIDRHHLRPGNWQTRAANHTGRRGQEGWSASEMDGALQNRSGNEESVVVGEINRPNHYYFKRIVFQKFNFRNGIYAPDNALAPHEQRFMDGMKSATLTIYQNGGIWLELPVPEMVDILPRHSGRGITFQKSASEQVFFHSAREGPAEIALGEGTPRELSVRERALYTAVYSPIALEEWPGMFGQYLRALVEIIERQDSVISAPEIASAVQALISETMVYAKSGASPTNALDAVAGGKIQCSWAAALTTGILRQYFGIPARVVAGDTGMVDANRPDISFIIRGQDLHGWTEFYDADKKMWQIVDSTPGDSELEDGEGGGSLGGALGALGNRAASSGSRGGGPSFSQMMLNRHFKMPSFLEDWKNRLSKVGYESEKSLGPADGIGNPFAGLKMPEGLKKALLGMFNFSRFKREEIEEIADEMLSRQRKETMFGILAIHEWSRIFTDEIRSSKNVQEKLLRYRIRLLRHSEKNAVKESLLKKIDEMLVQFSAFPEVKFSSFAELQGLLNHANAEIRYQASWVMRLIYSEVKSLRALAGNERAYLFHALTILKNTTPLDEFATAKRLKEKLKNLGERFNFDESLKSISRAHGLKTPGQFLSAFSTNPAVQELVMTIQAGLQIGGYELPQQIRSAYRSYEKQLVTRSDNDPEVEIASDLSHPQNIIKSGFGAAFDLFRFITGNMEEKVFHENIPVTNYQPIYEHLAIILDDGLMSERVLHHRLAFLGLVQKAMRSGQKISFLLQKGGEVQILTGSSQIGELPPISHAYPSIKGEKIREALSRLKPDRVLRFQFLSSSDRYGLDLADPIEAKFHAGIPTVQLRFDATDLLGKETSDDHDTKINVAPFLLYDENAARFREVLLEASRAEPDEKLFRAADFSYLRAEKPKVLTFEERLEWEDFKAALNERLLTWQDYEPSPAVERIITDWGSAIRDSPSTLEEPFYKHGDFAIHATIQFVHTFFRMRLDQLAYSIAKSTLKDLIYPIKDIDPEINALYEQLK